MRRLHKRRQIAAQMRKTRKAGIHIIRCEDGHAFANVLIRSHFVLNILKQMTIPAP